MQKIFCCPALELFHCLPLWKTVLFVSSRAFLLSTPTFLLSTLYKNSEATWKKTTKCNKRYKSLSPIKVSLKHLPQQYFLPKIGTFATLFGSFLKLLPQNRLLLDNIENTKKTLFYKSSRKASGLISSRQFLHKNAPFPNRPPNKRLLGP